jgi:hypothetical protein
MDDLLPNKLLEAITQGDSLKDSTVPECTEHAGQVCFGGKRYVPEGNQLWLRLIQEHHDTTLAGHPGCAQRFDLLDRKFYWKDLRKRVDQYVRNCHCCQHSRTLRHATFRVLRPLPVPEKQWEEISMDFVVRLPECEGFNAVWVVVDRLSKMRHFIPCHTKIDAIGLAKLFLREVVLLHGLPRTIVSDQGPQFASTIWGQICSLVVNRSTNVYCVSSTDRWSDGTNECRDETVHTHVC